jgi:hypothetical protein
MIANRSLLSLVGSVVITCVIALPGRAVTISYVGTEPGTSASGSATQNWSNPGVAKLYATGTSNEYGKDGYWQIRPIPNPAGTNVSQAVGNGNDLGTSAGSFPTLSSGTPSFLGSIAGAAGTFVNFGGYPLFTGPDGSSLYRQGSLSVSVNQGPYNTPSGSNNGYFGETLSFSLTYSGTVRVGFAVDSVADGNYAPNYVGIYSNSTGTIYSAALTRDGTPDMAVFDIANPAGETFSVAQWQLAGTQSVSAMSLVTFDLVPVPEPSAAALLAAAAAAAAIFVRRRP